MGGCAWISENTFETVDSYFWLTGNLLLFVEIEKYREKNIFC